MSIPLATIQVRHDALAAQFEAGQRQYNELEQTLKQLGRDLDVLCGRLLEIEELLKGGDDGDRPAAEARP